MIGPVVEYDIFPSFHSVDNIEYEGQSKITEPYLITFKFVVVDNKCDYVLLVLYVIHVLTVNNYPREASIMVARQLKVVGQSVAFTISATRNIQYVFKKLVYLIVFVIDILDIYLTSIYHIIF